MRTDFDQDHAGGPPPWLPSPDAGRAAIERIERDAREAARDRIAAEPDPRCVTVITTAEPVRKVFAIDPGTGSLTKTATASINSGTGITARIDSLADFVDLLREVTEAPDKVMVLGAFRGAPRFGAPFEVGAQWFTRMRPGAIARNKANVAQSVWILLDFDDWPGMPEGWPAMDSAARVAFLETVIPGISRCARVEWCSSSARVMREGSAEACRVGERPVVIVITDDMVHDLVVSDGGSRRTVTGAIDMDLFGGVVCFTLSTIQTEQEIRRAFRNGAALLYGRLGRVEVNALGDVFRCIDGRVDDAGDFAQEERRIAKQVRRRGCR